MKSLKFFLLVIILSCKSDDKVSIKPILLESAWEQMTGIIDGQYTSFKMFLKIDFSSDNSVEIEWSYGGVSSDPDLNLVVHRVLTKFEFDEEARTIYFPQNLDTLQIEYPVGTISTAFVRLNKMKILNVKSERLDVEFINSNSTGYLLGYGKAYFQPFKPK